MKSYYIEVEFSGTRTYLVKGKDEEDAKKRLVAGKYEGVEEDSESDIDENDILSVEDIDE